MPDLNKRLSAISSMIIPGESAADIGTDHALLPVYLIENGIVPQAIASDLADEPFHRASKIAAQSYPDKIDVRQGYGLQVLQAGEVSTVIIAGVGGETIVNILSHDWQKSSSFKRFILQPMSRAHVLRQALCSRGWPLEKEKIIYENNFFYAIISCSPGDKSYYLSDIEMDIGPLLLKGGSRLEKQYRSYWLNKYKRIYSSLLKSRPDKDTPIRALKYRDKIIMLEGIINEGQG